MVVGSGDGDVVGGPCVTVASFVVGWGVVLLVVESCSCGIEVVGG